MTVVKKTFKELVFTKNNIEHRVQFEIVTKDNNEKSLYIKLLDTNLINELSSDQEIEIRLYKLNSVFNFKSKVKKVFKHLNELSITVPSKNQKLNHVENQKFPFSTTIKIAWSNNKELFAESFNISKTGISFNSKSFFYNGDILFISFHSAAESKIYNLEIKINNLFIGEEGNIIYEADFAEWIDDELTALLKYLELKEQKRQLKLEKEREKEENNETEKAKPNFIQKLLIQSKLIPSSNFSLI